MSASASAASCSCTPTSAKKSTRVYAGGIAAAVGLKKTFTGDTLCDARTSPIILENISFPEPVIRVALEPKSKEDQDKMGDSLMKMTEEDPTFHWTFDEETGQTLISGHGRAPPRSHRRPHVPRA